MDATCQEWGCGVGRVATGCGKNIHLQSARDESIKYLFTGRSKPQPLSSINSLPLIGDIWPFYSSLTPNIFRILLSESMNENKKTIRDGGAPRYRLLRLLRDGWRYQIGWIFGKVPKGGGSFSIQKLMLQTLGTLNRAFLAWNWYKKSKFRVQGTFFQQLYWEKYHQSRR